MRNETKVYLSQTRQDRKIPQSARFNNKFSSLKNTLSLLPAPAFTPRFRDSILVPLFLFPRNEKSELFVAFIRT